MLIAFMALSACQFSASDAQDVRESRNDQTGLYELQSPRLHLITDVPIDDELRSWPALLEQCLEQWQTYFQREPSSMANYHVKVYLIADDQRFQQNSLLKDVPGFEDGYQFGNLLCVREQPSVYYRRHLFIHEATHWIMYCMYGGAGSPWLMEGMAEMQGTHALHRGKLTLNMIPAAPQQVPYWGRLRLIEQTLEQGNAPSLSDILAYGNQREERMNRYSWSWAACVFFTNHPVYGPILREQYSQPLDYSDRLSRMFKAKLAERWQDVLIDWNAYVSDLDFGYDVKRSLLVTPSGAKSQRLQGTSHFQLATDKGWQSTGIELEAGTAVQLNCNGTYKLRDGKAWQARSGAEGNPAFNDWMVEPQGISLEYFRGKPRGCVVASVVSSDGPEKTERWEVLKIGKSATLSPKATGVLFLKINEASSELFDNNGEISVQIAVTSPR